MSDFRMPIMRHGKNIGHITFEATDAIRSRANRNHGQTLERLSERGGLSWSEFYCAVYNKPLSDVRHDDAARDAVRDHFIRELNWKWEAAQPPNPTPSP